MTARGDADHGDEADAHAIGRERRLGQQPGSEDRHSTSSVKNSIDQRFRLHLVGDFGL